MTETKIRHSGFTLMEMMVGIAVLAIMTGIAIPSFMSMLPGMRLNGAARTVMGDLMDARMMAVKENRQFKVSFLGDNHSYNIFRAVDNDNDGTWDDWEVTSTKDIQNEHVGVTFSSSDDTPPIFHPKGTVSDPPTLTLQNTEGDCKQVSVTLAGRVKIQECGE